AYLVAVHAARERLVLELLLHRGDLQVAEAPGRAHQRARDEETTQLVDREQRLREPRVAGHARVRRVSEDRPAQRLGEPPLAQQAYAPRRMTVGGRVVLVRELLVVKSVQQPHDPPRLRILALLQGVRAR